MAVSTCTKKTCKTVADTKAKVNFPPFKHYILDSAGVNPREVVRSHWVGGLHNGHFSVDHGTISNELGRRFMKLVERDSQRDQIQYEAAFAGLG